MRTSPGMLPLVIGLVFVVSEARCAETAPEPADARAARLAARLGSVAFAEREAAAAELETLGLDALAALRKASRSDDLEVRRRAAELMSRIERRLETVRLLEPRRVRLLFRDTPVAQAVDDVARQTGLAVKLHEPDKAKLADRKVTLDTGDTTLWDAFGQFVQKTGLVERFEPSAARSARYYDGGGRGGARRVVWGGSSYRDPYGNPQNVGIVLADGTPPALPTAEAMALRVRALPPSTPMPGWMKGDREALLPLEVTPPPNLEWQGVMALRIDYAVDDRGQPLSQPELYTGARVPRANEWEDVVWIMEDEMRNTNRYPATPFQVPARLKLGDRPAATIKELRGTLAAVVQTPVERLLAVDRVLESGGRTVTGPAGCFVKLIEVKKEENGQYKLCVQVKMPSQDLGLNANGGVRFVPFRNGNQEKVLLETAGLEARGLALVDGKGQRLYLATGSVTAEVEAQAELYELYFQPRPGDGEPARLLYAGKRPAVVEVPFVLKDVPLK